MTNSESAGKRGLVTSNRALINKLKLVKDSHEKDRLINSLKQVTEPTVISFLNAHALTMADRDTKFRANLDASTILLRDGSGISLLLRTLGLNPGFNMNGTDFIPEVIKAFSDTNVAFYGTQDPWLNKAAGIFRESGANIGSVIDGFDKAEVYVEDAKRTKPKLIILAMGMPKQEEVAMRIQSALDFPVVIVNGGAILDFVSGRFPRAPKFLRLIGMEWFYRLIKEPKRLARRYILGIFTFGATAIRVILQRRTQA